MSQHALPFADHQVTQPAATDIDGMRELAKLARDLIAVGKAPPSPLIKALKTSALYDLQAHLWPDRKSMAADLQISAKTVDSWAGKGAPIGAHEPISRAAVYRWLWQRDRDHLLEVDHSDQVRERRQQAEIRIAEAKAQQLEGRIQAEIDAGISATVAQLAAALRAQLTGPLIEQLWAAAHQTDRASAVPAMRRQLDDALTGLARHHHALPTAETAPAPAEPAPAKRQRTPRRRRGPTTSDASALVGRCIAYLRRHGPARTADLAAHTRHTAHQVAAALQHHGGSHISRHRDGRHTVWTLTDNPTEPPTGATP